MALQSQAQLLDELMGRNRNVGPGARINSVRFDDEDVCKHSLIGFCPHDLFVNTRADLGPCNKIHDEGLKKQYEKSSRFGRMGYEDDYERFLRSLLNDVERKIRRNSERLKLTQTESTDGTKNPIQVKQEKVEELKEIINGKIKEAEHLGEEGNIEEAQTIVVEIDKLRAECKYLENQIELAIHNAEQKQMEVCEVCGSFLIVNDAQSRVEEHISGKQHQGYAKLRSALEEIRKKRQEEYERKRKERSSSRTRDEKDKDRDRRDRDRNDRDRDRDRRDRDRRDRDRDADRYRSDRDRRDRDRDRSRDRRGSPSKSNGSSSSSNNKNNNHKNKDRDDRDSDRKRHRSRSRSGSRDRKRDYRSNGNGDHKSSSKTLKENGSTNGNHSDDSSNSTNKRKLEEETNEFLKFVDQISSKKKEKSAEDNKVEAEDDEKEEGQI
jgi:hypothetical protein